MEIQRIDPGHDPWDAYVAHLQRTDQARWVLDAAGRPAEPYLFLGAVVAGDVVGDLSLRVQPLLVPATEWSGGVERTLESHDGIPLTEAYVQTFHVDAAHRRRGIGRALQAAALTWAAEEGCLQLRSWSSLDRPANYALKLSMGFVLHPAIHDAAAGYPVSGVYFVKRVDGDTPLTQPRC